MIEWTFERIMYHYMGLPFLCMLGSFRIIQADYFFSFFNFNARSAFIFSIGCFSLVRFSTMLNAAQRTHFHTLTISKTCDLCASFLIPVISKNFQLLLDIKPFRRCIFRLTLCILSLNCHGKLERFTIYNIVLKVIFDNWRHLISDSVWRIDSMVCVLKQLSGKSVFHFVLCSFASVYIFLTKLY